ncbi:MAG: hypothetical protein OEU51_00490 [Gammaproteobacteria bacterium]|nr:hypothetical protein [Gammaproteobacteria bacterium]
MTDSQNTDVSSGHACVEPGWFARAGLAKRRDVRVVVLAQPLPASGIPVSNAVKQIA